jgi:hypothetical protein
MNHFSPTILSALALGAFALGCGPNPKSTLPENAGAELTAKDLAYLQDFHAWKLPVPSSQHPGMRVRLVLVGADGSGAELFSTANSTALAWTNLLLGFRYEGGRFAGRLHAQSPEGSLTYTLNFTNASTERPRSWAEGARWDGNRAELATFWNSDEAARRGGNDYSTLAVELAN